MTFAKGAYETNKLETNLEKEAKQRNVRKSTRNKVKINFYPQTSGFEATERPKHNFYYERVPAHLESNYMYFDPRVQKGQITTY